MQFFAHIVSLIGRNIFHTIAEDTGGLIFLQNDTVPVNIDLERILIVDVKCFAQFRRNDDTAEIVDWTDDSC